MLLRLLLLLLLLLSVGCLLCLLSQSILLRLKLHGQPLICALHPRRNTPRLKLFLLLKTTSKLSITEDRGDGRRAWIRHTEVHEKVPWKGTKFRRADVLTEIPAVQPSLLDNDEVSTHKVQLIGLLCEVVIRHHVRRDRLLRCIRM